MKKKLFSRGLYVEGLRQLKLTGSIFLAILLLVGLAVPVLQYVNYLDYINNFAEDGFSYSPEVVDFIEMCTMVVGIAFVAAPVFTFILFGSFNKRSSSDFYHSLPYTRACMFLSFTAAIFTWLVGLTVIYCGATIATYALMPQVFIVNLVGMGDIMLTMLAVAMMLVFGIICAMSITGTFIANITCTGLILFLPRLIITLVTFVLGTIAPIIEGHFGIFSPEYNVIVGCFYNAFVYSDDTTFVNNLPADIYSICLALVYAAAALYLFSKRKSETASHPAPGKAMQHAIRICVGLVISSIVTCALISGATVSVCVVFYIVAIIVYFAYELITQKTFRTIPKTIPGLAILLGLNIAIVAVCLGSAAYIHSYAPENEQVSAIYIKDAYGRNYFDTVEISEYVSDKAGQIKIEDRNAINIAAENLRKNAKRSASGNFYPYTGWEDYDESGYTELHITYISKGGAKKTRNIYMSLDDYADLMSNVQTNDEYKEAFCNIPEAIRRTVNLRDMETYNEFDITDDEYLEILDCFREEAKGMDFAKWSTFIANGTENYNTSFELTFQPVGEDMELRIIFDSHYFPKTMEMVMEKINRGAKDDIERFYDIISDYENATEDYVYLHLRLDSVSEEDDWQLYTHYYYEDGGDAETSDTLIADLKAMGEEMKKCELTIEEYVLAHLTYEEDPNEDGVYRTYESTFFLPYPKNFEPKSSNFQFIEKEYDYEKYYYEEVVVID